jgi:thioredoxin reductase (NADPH)
VYYGAAMTEAATYRGQDICVVGGANSAGQGALFFSRYARKVTMLLRAGDLRVSMSQYLVDRIKATENIEVKTCVSIASASGDGHLERITVRDIASGAESELETAALFIFIGVAPRSEPFADVLERDDAGFILTGLDLPRADGNHPRGWMLERSPFIFESNVPGVFAVGDVRAGANRRVAAAVGEGSAGIYMVHKYLETV